MHHSPPHRSHPCFGLHKCFASVDECQWVQFFFFPRGGMLHPRFCVRHHFVRLPLHCHLLHGNKNIMEYRWEGSTSTAIPPTSDSDIVGQHSKIGEITFRAVLIRVLFIAILLIHLGIQLNILPCC